VNSVQLSSAGKCYERRWALRNVELTLAPGERLALLGHNGAGKTTLLKLILGLIRPDEGQIRVFGKTPGIARGSDKTIGFLPENVAFHDAMSGRETLHFYARLKRRPLTECGPLLERVGLSYAIDRRVSTYSKGMRQRLGLAQALLGSPRLLLLDEPTTGLDPALRLIFYDILKDLAGQGTTVLLSSHLLTELEERTDRIAVMHGGRLLIVGRLADLRDQAGLPLEVTLKIAAGKAPAVISALAQFAADDIEGDNLRLTCQPEDKMSLLRHVGSLGADILDIDISQPGLDSIYAQFTNAANAEEGTR
jgi:Cu-processing system ATP-binding protein